MQYKPTNKNNTIMEAKNIAKLLLNKRVVFDETNCYGTTTANRRTGKVVKVDDRENKIVLFVDDKKTDKMYLSIYHIPKPLSRDIDRCYELHNFIRVQDENHHQYELRLYAKRYNF